MKLFQNYCYLDTDTVIESIESNPFLSQINILKSVQKISNDQLELNFYKKPKIVNVTLHDCSAVGVANSYSGLSLADANELGWLMALAMITAWGIKILRRTL
jgi:hypothetical protein